MSSPSTAQYRSRVTRSRSAESRNAPPSRMSCARSAAEWRVYGWFTPRTTRRRVQRLLVQGRARRSSRQKGEVRRQVVRGSQGPRVVLAELLLEALVGLPVGSQRLPVVPDGAQVGAQAAGSHQGVRVIRSQGGALPFQDIRVELEGLAEPALRPEHIGDVKAQVQRLLMVGSELGGPEILQPMGQAEARLELTVLPLVPHPVDEQLPGPRVVALLGDGRSEMRPDDVVAGPVRRVIGVPAVRPGADQDLVHFMLRLDLLLVRHLGADHGLHQPVDLQRVAAADRP